MTARRFRAGTVARCHAAALADLHRAAWGTAPALPFHPVADLRAAILTRINSEN